MKVNEIMDDEVFVVRENEQVSHARNLMLKHGQGRVIVVDRDDNPIGIVTERDLSLRLRGSGPKWKSRSIDKISIRRVMNNGLITIDAGSNAKDAVETMLRNNISSIPVVDEEGLAGMITKTDLMKFYISKYANTWKVQDLMTKEVITVNENHTISHVVSTMEENNINGLMVMFDSEVAGIITPADISFASVDDPETGVSVERIYFIRQLANGEDKRKAKEVPLLTAGDIMNEDYVKISSDVDAVEAAKLMSNEGVSHIPVIDGEDLVGIITKTDIIKGIQ